MVGLSALWLPILLSAVAVFVLSSVIHMATKWHKDDYHRLPDEDKTRDLLRPLAIPPGDYIVPCPADAKEMGTPQFLEKWKQGPNLVVTVLPTGPWAMARNLISWFVYALAIGVFAAYVAGRALPAGAPYLRVFRFAGVTAFLGYSAALWQMAIWYRRSIGTTIRSTIDGLIYALVTAGFFGWLWPR